MQKMFKMDTVSFLANGKSVVTFFFCLISCLKPNSIENPRQCIRHEIRQISPEMLQNVRHVCYYRFAICQERNGAHFEHLLH
jgi:hypothetical protein